MLAYCLARKSLSLSLVGISAAAVAARRGNGGSRGRRSSWVAALPLLAGVALTLFAGCDNQEAILLQIRPPQGVQLSQYEVRIQDRNTRTLVYQSGIQPVSAVASGRDLFAQPLRLGLKLSQSGSFLVFVRASTGTLLPDGPPPAQRGSEYFFATVTQTSGTTEVDSDLLEVKPDYDRDFDHFPDFMTWPLDNLAAKVQYQSQLGVLDCVDRDPGPADPPLPASLYAVEINPLAIPRCGLPIDISCGPAAPACKDTDGDGENESTDCDDNDPKRFHKNPRPRNCCTCTDRKSCATDHSKLADQSLCQPARCDNAFDFNCTGLVVPCFVDEDCDGYAANDPVPSQRDCDDTNPDVHPGATKNCADPSRDWACDGNPLGGCVSCDLDGDGYQRLDAAAKCPDKNDTHPGQIDCDDTDRGVFPGSTSYAGATLVISDLRKSEGGGSVAAALRRLCANKQVDGKTAQDADCDAKPQLNCPPAMAGGKVCDSDGDGFPNNNAGCNPGGLPVDCDDSDFKTFPGAPDRCGDGKAQNCSSDTACAMDADKDGYNFDVDCDDNDPARHPFAAEVCNGADDDCDGLVDELNPDNQGTRMTETHGSVTGRLTCTDNNVGDCGLPKGGPFPGLCVCSGLVPGKHAADNMRQACPGTRDDNVTAPKCFGATQPGLQTCKASTPLADEDCDGRTDAPDGKNLKEYTDDCGVNQGSCMAGKVIGCDRSQVNKFSITTGFKVQPPFDEERRFLVCDNTAVYPSTELCDTKDNDCDAIVDNCSLGVAGTVPKCCAMVNMCLDLNTNFNYCGSCTFACSTTNASVCAAGKCMCGSLAACSGTRGLCKGGASCVQCLDDTNCAGTPATPRCKGADTCVQCLSSADCAGTPATPACNTTTNTCVACVGDTDCAGTPATPVCKTSVPKCVQCVVNSDCGPGKQCDPSNNTCVQCIDDSGCGGATPVCKTATHTCVGCTADGQCAGLRCSPMTNTCVECLMDAPDCSGKPGLPKCNTNTSMCVECLAAADCPVTGNKCQNNACVECVMNADCSDPNKPRCDPMGYMCRQCLANADCMGRVGTPQCDTTSHLCVQCQADAHCTMVAGKPACDTTKEMCVECVNSTHCAMVAGRPVCDTTKEMCVECLNNTHCAMVAGRPVCNPTTEMCVECVSSTDCAMVAGKPYCYAAANSCVECLDDMDCGTGFVCDMDHTCVAMARAPKTDKRLSGR